MAWNEQDHPRDDNGKFTFKDGGETTKDVLFKKSNIQKEIETIKQKKKKRIT